MDKKIYCSKCNGLIKHNYMGYDIIKDITEQTGYVYAVYKCGNCSVERFRVEDLCKLEKIVENKK